MLKWLRTRLWKYLCWADQPVNWKKGTSDDSTSVSHVRQPVEGDFQVVLFSPSLFCCCRSREVAHNRTRAGKRTGNSCGVHHLEGNFLFPLLRLDTQTLARKRDEKGMKSRIYCLFTPFVERQARHTYCTLTERKESETHTHTDCDNTKRLSSFTHSSLSLSSPSKVGRGLRGSTDTERHCDCSRISK